MKMNLSKMMFIMTMTMSIMMTMSSNSMMFSWMSMEINLISFLPLLKKSNKMNEQSMKYLIIQSMSSSIMMTSMIINAIINCPINESILMMMSILMKMGMIPFHLWVPSIMQMMSWEMCMMMMTMQKMIPTIIATQMTSIKLMMMSMIMSMIMAPISGMKQTSLKKLMAYSSISNSPVMIFSLMISKQQFIFLLIMYTTINLTMMNTFKKNNINFLNQINNQTNLTKMSLMISSLSMSGMPPTLGFLMKWMIMKSTICMTPMIPLIMLISSILSTFMYLNMMIPTMTKSNKLKMKKLMKKESIIPIILNLMGIPMMMIFKLN
ncbi:NADH dehydrogenase subunit 2 (mitochondrion) [Lycorma delicatula]|uniref:NADH-ubiquinone oxidoreductase chain 2 n=1 Tax=Lycorma delicatula TaxID=130591 RepID=C5HIJ8_LYCDL|nr:NADH dehydrogenase subunit 2 [Lycorma delicatula]ACJ69443.1 NADH dehydrogenase subunit 2 [Lycorma delicatula]QGN74305.1 NADH dehydrogenase subunit 2 [Lycorma delicatula]QPN48293.1 NADH dehydrogenase subunit 2 [Lycorma delicatula]QPN48306.1 NADH dehydrogenase subunit 2 [Lycorma delicatula]QPN48319.1 NADH dehydrogenase subunit 2 [Lycorma delicatula]